jgi:hypothetical protein
MRHTDWPQLELISTFHSHPSEDLGGGALRKGDMAFWPVFHEFVCLGMDELAHMVIAMSGIPCSEEAELDRLFPLTPAATDCRLSS